MFDIALIGYGPAGATLANLLGQAGLSVVVLEKDAAIYPLPRAIHFDGEVMRIFQGMGLRGAVEAISRPGLKGMEFVNAGGKTLLVRGGTTAQGPHGCANNYYFHQPELEAVLRAEGAALVVEGGEGTWQVVRNLMGVTNPIKSAPGTIRGDLANFMTENLVHGSDSVESAAREVSLFFPSL